MNKRLIQDKKICAGTTVSRFLALLLVSVMLFGFSACGGEEIDDGGLPEEDSAVAGSGTLEGWPEDFYGQSLTAPATKGKITECSNETNAFGDNAYTIRIDGMTYEEYYKYCETLESLDGWSTRNDEGVSAMPAEEPDTGYYVTYCTGAYGALPYISAQHIGESAAEMKDIPRFQMFIFETWD